MPSFSSFPLSYLFKAQLFPWQCQSSTPGRVLIFQACCTLTSALAFHHVMRMQFLLCSCRLTGKWNTALFEGRIQKTQPNNWCQFPPLALFHRAWRNSAVPRHSDTVCIFSLWQPETSNHSQIFSKINLLLYIWVNVFLALPEPNIAACRWKVLS